MSRVLTPPPPRKGREGPPPRPVPAKRRRGRLGYRTAQALTTAGVYAALLLLSLVFLLPFGWMLSASLKTNATVHEYPPRLIPSEEVVVERDGRTLRQADWRAPDGQVRRVLLVDERPGGLVIEADGVERVVPRGEVEVVRVANPRWGNYPEAWTSRPFTRYTVNSAIITLSCIFGQVLSASLVAFGFARLRFPGRGPLFLVVLSTLMLPQQVTMMPQYLIFRSFGWIDTFLPLIVPSFLGGGAFFIFLFRQFFMTLPRELDESARLDGASWFRVYWNILMPLSRPIIATVAVFAFIAHWNEFMGPLIYLNSSEKMTLALGLRQFQGAYGTYLHLLMAAATVALLPVLVIFFAAQRYFVKSIVLTGLKG